MLSVFHDKLFASLFNNDLLIFGFALVELGFIIATLFFAFATRNKLKSWRAKQNVEFCSWLHKCLNWFYVMFTDLISQFPMLGIFGTVVALLSVDLSAGDMANLKDNFFDALTSTAWGIVFGFGFKLIHSIFVNFIEDQIEGSREMSADPAVRPVKKKKGRR